MKKLMIAALAAVAMVGMAQAVSYGHAITAYVQAYSADKDPNYSHSSWYSCYVMRQDDAMAAMGVTYAVTYETMAMWLGQDFAANKKSVITHAENVGFEGYDSSSMRYYIQKIGTISTSILDDAIGVVFYADDSNNFAYNVFANTAGLDVFLFGSDGTSSDWMAAMVPEPTSGLLLLLGFAGLALKRNVSHGV